MLNQLELFKNKLNEKSSQENPEGTNDGKVHENSMTFKQRFEDVVTKLTSDEIIQAFNQLSAYEQNFKDKLNHLKRITIQTIRKELLKCWDGPMLTILNELSDDEKNQLLPYLRYWQGVGIKPDAFVSENVTTTNPKTFGNYVVRRL